MKNIAKLVGIIALVTIIGISVTACDLNIYSYTFDNRSSYTVTVSCSDLDPPEFTVNAGKTKTVKSSSSFLWGIDYEPEDKVNVTTETGKLIFTDK